MRLAKRTYALPAGTVERFEREVDSGRRSAVVAAIIERYLVEKEREALRRDIEEGCRDMWDIYKEAATEWEATDDALHRSVAY